MGFEPMLMTWQATVLPLNYDCIRISIVKVRGRAGQESAYNPPELPSATGETRTLACWVEANYATFTPQSHV